MSGVRYLVRHGQSEWNVLRRTQGQTVHPRLTQQGRAQAQQVATRIQQDLAGTRVDLIISSDLARAAESARIIGEILDARVQLDQRLREQCLGVLEGKSYDETFAAADALDWTQPGQRVAGGESFDEVQKRMVEVIESATDATVIFVSHGDAIRTVLAHLAGLAPHEATWTDVPNGTVVKIDTNRAWAKLEPVEI